jgi:hypothetical protein
MNMNKLEKVLNNNYKPAATLLPLYMSTQQQINQIYTQTNEMFWGLAAAVSLMAGYAVYRYYKSIKERY